MDEYARGRTPSPCVLCNQAIKFGSLHRRAVHLGCEKIATGHYVRLEERDGAWRLLRPSDRNKDQSYFLHRLSQEQLGRCLFPLESWTKPEVAAYAEKHGLPVSVSSKEESQDLCFVSNDGHAVYVEERRPELKQAGEIVNTEGEVLGAHAGFHHYTIGQRRGLGVAAPMRLYVKSIDAETNRVVLGSRDDVMATHCVAENVHWLAGPPEEETFTAACRIRYRHEAARVRARQLDGKTVRLDFDEPQFAITPGQAAVMYAGDEVLGGGWISSR
ncbi:MAG: tRNA 2-thiouridine(34) synthase MnmA [Verrucomicrobiota bacterium]